MSGTNGMTGGATRSLPEWAAWRPDPSAAELTVGVEEEVMLLDPATWSLANRSAELATGLEEELRAYTATETHACVLELLTDPHERVADAVAQLHDLRRRLEDELRARDLRAAAAGTHPLAVWEDVAVTPGDRQRALHSALGALVRREPTFALHVHVKVFDAEAAVTLLNRLRGHVPLLLALAANSPFWQGRDSGLASARIPLFDGFPRTGTPRTFDGYGDYVETLDRLIRCGAFADPSFVWWDLRLQPRLGTVEVRVMDAQTTVEGTSALAGLVQCLARLELDEGLVAADPLGTPELLAENRFRAARDGIEADLLDPLGERLVPARSVLDEVLEACAPHARALGCAHELSMVERLADRSGASAQMGAAHGGKPGLETVAGLAHAFRRPWSSPSASDAPEEAAA